MPTMEEMYAPGARGPLQHPGEPERCAGCHEVSTALLVCDDIDGKGEATDPLQRAK